MHPGVYAEYEKIAAARNIRGAVLEVGATPDEASLLNLTALRQASNKIGLNLQGPADYGDFHILQGDANDMTCFADNRFDAVFCNAVLEHDRYFWKTLDEIRRVTRPGGLIVIGAPGFANLPYARSMRRLLGRIYPLAHSTPTLPVHNYPGDYYRFSEQAFREVVMAGLQEVEIRSVLAPPRLIGVGIKPAREAPP